MSTVKSDDSDAYYEYRADRGFGAVVREGLDDLVAGARLYDIWVPVAWRDLRKQTHRTLLGPLWSIVGTGIQVGALGYVYGALLKSDPADGYPYIAAGLILWFFISGSILGGLGVFPGGAAVLQERSLPVSFTVYRYTIRLFLELCIKFVVFVIVAALVELPVNWNTLLALPALVLFALSGFWVVLLFGVAGVRYRDLHQLLSPLMLLAFLASPVLWQKKLLAGSAFVAEYNPFTHYLALVREPLLGHLPALNSVLVVIGMTSVISAIAILVFVIAKNRIVFWL